MAEAERRPAPPPVLAPPGTSRLSSAVSCACGVALAILRSFQTLNKTLTQQKQPTTET